jgi:hypothetical protein
MAGGKRINASDMVPTVAVRDGRALFAVGASGGDLIMPCVSQIAALMLDFDLSPEAAFHSPTLDASHRGCLRADRLRLQGRAAARRRPGRRAGGAAQGGRRGDPRQDQPSLVDAALICKEFLTLIHVIECGLLSGLLARPDTCRWPGW